jgi:pimeloyl-ACP methyl ester carboxylesterase
MFISQVNAAAWNHRLRGGFGTTIGALKAMAEREDLLTYLSSTAFAKGVVLIHGDADALIPIERAKEIRVAMPSARLVVVQGAGHMPMMEFPKATAIGLKFLAG